jgi:hypothetical protein
LSPDPESGENYFGTSGEFYFGIDMRPLSSIDLYSSTTTLFDALGDGDMFDINDFGFISLVVNYVNQPALGATIMRANNFSRFDVSVSATSMSPVPLPAGLPLLLAGIGGMALLRRRQRKQA